MKNTPIHLNTSDRRRFFAKVVEVENGCHEWIAGKHAGYGIFCINKETARVRAHRVAWVIAHNQQIPEGMEICHHCDNPSCVNPEHLFVGTQTDNMQDKVDKGKNNTQILCKDQVFEIYKLRDSGWSAKKLSLKYGLSIHGIRRILEGNSWKRLYDDYYQRREVKRCQPS